MEISASLVKDLRERIKGVRIKLINSFITDEFIDNILSFIDNKDKLGLEVRFTIWDPGEKISVDLKAKDYKINISTEFINYIYSFDNIDVQFYLN